MFYCTLRDLVLYLHKDEHGFKKNQVCNNRTPPPNVCNRKHNQIPFLKSPPHR